MIIKPKTALKKPPTAKENVASDIAMMQSAMSSVFATGRGTHLVCVGVSFVMPSATSVKSPFQKYADIVTNAADSARI